VKKDISAENVPLAEVEVEEAEVEDAAEV